MKDLCSTLGLLLMVHVASAQSPDEIQKQKLAARRTPVVEAYERARDAIVNITASETIQVSRWGGGTLEDMFSLPRRPATAQRTSIGSGFVMHEDGYVVTNAHVAAQGADFEVSFADGAKYPAQIVARDVTHDLAILKIDAAKSFKALPLGASDDLMIGETTIAVGNPVGLQNTVTTGIVSALHRDLDANGRVLYGDVIQTDAGINPGNSGGPLLNVLGEVIGINTAIRTDAQNIGFAIPVDQLRKLLPDLLDPEKVGRARLGLRLDPGEPRVVQVRAETPASRAGLNAGDVIERVGDKPVRSAADFYLGLLEHQPGDVVRLEYARDGRSLHADVKLDASPKLDGKQLALKLFGVSVDNLSEKAARNLGWARNEGVVVTTVEADSPAAKAGLQPGDLLYTLGSYRLQNVDQFGSLLEDVQSGARADVGFVRMFRSRARLLEGEIVAR